MNESLGITNIISGQHWAPGIEPQKIVSLVSNALDGDGDVDIETLQGLFVSANWALEVNANISSITDMTATDLMDGYYLFVIYDEQLKDNPILLFLSLKKKQVDFLVVQLDHKSQRVVIYRYQTTAEQFYEALTALDMLDVDMFNMNPLAQ